MSTHSLCGAQPDVQLHREHVVTACYSRDTVKGRKVTAQIQCPKTEGTSARARPQFGTGPCNVVPS